MFKHQNSVEFDQLWPYIARDTSTSASPRRLEIKASNERYQRSCLSLDWINLAEELEVLELARSLGSHNLSSWHSSHLGWRIFPHNCFCSIRTPDKLYEVKRDFRSASRSRVSRKAFRLSSWNRVSRVSPGRRISRNDLLKRPLLLWYSTFWVYSGLASSVAGAIMHKTSYCLWKKVRETTSLVKKDTGSGGWLCSKLDSDARCSRLAR